MLRSRSKGCEGLPNVVGTSDAVHEYKAARRNCVGFPSEIMGYHVTVGSRGNSRNVPWNLTWDILQEFLYMGRPARILVTGIPTGYLISSWDPTVSRGFLPTGITPGSRRTPRDPTGFAGKLADITVDCVPPWRPVEYPTGRPTGPSPHGIPLGPVGIRKERQPCASLIRRVAE